MDGCDCSGKSFMARLSPAGRFYQALSVMKDLSESAVLLVRTGEIELRVSDASGAGIASMIINASTAFPSSSSSSFAFRFNVSELMDALDSDISESDFRSLWIFKMIKSPALRFLIGTGSTFIQDNEVEEIAPYTSDLRSLQLLPYRVIMPSKYLREAIAACDSDQNADFHLSYTSERVTWTTSNSETVHHIKDKKCVLEDVVAGVERRFVVEWLGFGEALAEASRAADVVALSPVGSPGMGNWIAFLFRFEEGSTLMFLVRGLKHLSGSLVAKGEDVDNDEDEDEDEDVDKSDDEDEDEDFTSNEDEDVDEDSDDSEDEEDGDNDDDEDEDEDVDNINDEQDGVHNDDDEVEDGWILV